MAKLEAMLPVGIVIETAREAGNNAKGLESGRGIDPLWSKQVICFSSTQILVIPPCGRWANR